MEFGSWDGLTFDEVREQLPATTSTPGSGRSTCRPAARRVVPTWSRSGCCASLDRLLAEHAGQTVLAVSHVTPIKLLVAHALGAPLESMFRMELAPASVTVLSFFDGRPTCSALKAAPPMRMFNAAPDGRGVLGR